MILRLCASASLALAGPAAARLAEPRAEQVQAEAPGSTLRDSDYRIGRIVYRLGSAARAHCPDRFPLTGLLFHHLAEYRPADRAEAIRRYGLDSGPGILAVIPDSPAARSGLAAGDVLVSVNGRPFPAPASVGAEEQSKRWRLRVEAPEILLEEQLRLGPVRLEVRRDGRSFPLTLESVPGCPARGRLARSGQANAFADGRYAIMTTRFLRFFRSDDELAVALAHELAHNILRHPQQLEAQGVPNGILRHIGRNARLVRATEEEADRLSVRLLWSAGYDLAAIIPFWRRLYARPDSQLQIISAHPSLRMRERIINEVLAELAPQPRPS
ncbi:M48 family metalloprotease [Allosphingosinicella sp.]|jgi:hypothetical protein|uniref:M48 family metallopeptidase n=1 Tax=Allosphingosinicella sp. TaxID=2823234 RepID=UPI002EFC75C7